LKTLATEIDAVRHTMAVGAGAQALGPTGGKAADAAGAPPI
jgi:hypothetical protein